MTLFALISPWSGSKQKESYIEMDSVPTLSLGLNADNLVLSYIFLLLLSGSESETIVQPKKSNQGTITLSREGFIMLFFHRSCNGPMKEYLFAKLSIQDWYLSWCFALFEQWLPPCQISDWLFPPQVSNQSGASPRRQDPPDWTSPVKV